MGVEVSNPVHSANTIIQPVAPSPVQSNTGVQEPGDAPARPPNRYKVLAPALNVALVISAGADVQPEPPVIVATALVAVADTIMV